MSTHKHPLKPCSHCGVGTRRECIVCRRPTCIEGGKCRDRRADTWVCLRCSPEEHATPLPLPPIQARRQDTAGGVSRIDARARSVLDDERMAFARGARWTR